jgi:hypothetical protein
MKSKSQLSFGPSNLPRLNKAQSGEVRDLIREGRLQYNLQAVDQARLAFAIEHQTLRERPLATEELGPFVLIAEAVRKSSQYRESNAGVRRLKQRIDDAMTPTKDRYGKGLLKRTAAMLIRSIASPGSLKVQKDDWHQKAFEIVAKFSLNLWPEFSIRVPAAFIPRRSLDELIVMVDEELKHDGMLPKSRTKVASILKATLNTHGQRMAHSFCDNALEELEKHGYRYPSPSYHEASNMVNTIFESFFPIQRGGVK